MSVLDDICFQMHAQSEGADVKLLEVNGISACVFVLFCGCYLDICRVLKLFRDT